MAHDWYRSNGVDDFVRGSGHARQAAFFFYFSTDHGCRIKVGDLENKLNKKKYWAQEDASILYDSVQTRMPAHTRHPKQAKVDTKKDLWFK